MIFLISLLGGVFFFNTLVAAASDSQSTFQKRFRQKVEAAGMFGRKLQNQEFRPKTAEFSRTPTPAFNKALPPIDLKSQASTEYSANNTPTSSAKNSISSIGTSSSKDSVSSDAFNVSRNLGKLKMPQSRRRQAIDVTPILDSNDQYRVALAYSCLARIEDSNIKREAEVAVGEVKTPQDKQELALAWLEYLSKIENVEDRNEAAAAVQHALAINKQCEARLWLQFLTRVPAGATRNKAIADVNSEISHEKKELMAKIWVEYLSKIDDVDMQKMAASSVRKSSYSKEQLAQEWLRLSGIGAPFIEKTEPTEDNWWRIISTIKDGVIKEEARQCIERGIAGHKEKALMANLWVRYLAKIVEKSKRDIAVNEMMRVSFNQWEDVAANHWLNYRLQ